MADAQTQEQPHAAVATRDLIGIAKGILSERFQITPETAFVVLTRLSLETNTKLHDLAATLVGTGALPGVKQAARPESDQRSGEST